MQVVPSVTASTPAEDTAPHEAESDVPDEDFYPDPPYDREEVNAAFDRLREMMDGCSASSRNLAAQLLISACILEGFDTRRRIVGAMRRLGFDYRHVVIILKAGTGSHTNDWWQVDAEGRYHNLQ